MTAAFLMKTWRICDKFT